MVRPTQAMQRPAEANPTQSKKDIPVNPLAPQPFQRLPSAKAHTFQLLVILFFQPLLLIITTLYLPQGIFRKDGPLPTLYTGVVTFLHTGMVEDEDRSAQIKALRYRFLLALQFSFIIQSLVINRLSWWFAVGDRIAKDESISRLRQNEGLMKQGENMVLTTIALPVPFLGATLGSILLGAPVSLVPYELLQTVVLGAYITLLALYAPLHILGDDWAAWVRLFIQVRPHNARERILQLQSFSVVAGAVLGSAALALDWDRTWQAWPIPPVLGALFGCLIGNVLAGASYALARAGPRAKPWVPKSGPGHLRKAVAAEQKKK